MSEMQLTKERGGFHWRDDWMFTRRPDGSVNIWRPNTNINILIPPNEWASIVASVSGCGETADSFADAQALHGGHPPWRLED